MKQKTYPSYKPSGVEWIGNVPRHWTICRLKHNTYIKARVGWHGLNSADFKTEGPYCVTGTDFKNGRISWDSCYRVTQERYDEDPYIQLRVEDLLITKDGTIGKTAVIHELPGPSTLNSGVFVVRPIRDYISPYLFWVLNSSVFTEFVGYNSKGSTIIHLYQDTFYNLPLPIPPVIEQKAIVIYLDQKTALIDSTIRQKERLIELLQEERTAIINRAVTRGLDPNVPMKDSGVEWIGEIPCNWESTSLKRIVSIPVTDGPHETPTFILEGVPFVSAEAIQNGSVNFSACRGFISIEEDERFSLKCKPQRGDVFVVKSGSTTGKVAYVNTDINFNIWSPIALVRAGENQVGRFLYYALSSNYFQTQVQLFWSFGTQPNIGMNVLENLQVVYPTEVEQQAIASYLDQKTILIDDTILKNLQQISALTEYRTALINEVVTGKRCVT
jgi:type I restriction enzyme S subunit